MRVRYRHCWHIPIDYSIRYLGQAAEPAKTLCASYKSKAESLYALLSSVMFHVPNPMQLNDTLSWTCLGQVLKLSILEYVLTS